MQRKIEREGVRASKREIECARESERVRARERENDVVTGAPGWRATARANERISERKRESASERVCVCGVCAARRTSRSYVYILLLFASWQ